MEPVTFDDIERQEQYARTQKPLWKIDLDDPGSEKEILNWLNAEVTYLKNANMERHRAMQRNLTLYKGIQYMDQDDRDVISRTRGPQRNQPIKKIVANHIFDLVSNRVSRLIKFKPAVQILPTNDEFTDIAASKASKSILDHIWYSQDFEGVLTVDWAKMKTVLGESYLFILWNKDKGDIHPDSKGMSEKDKKVPLLDENGTQEQDESGNPIFIADEIKVGDVEYTIESPFDVFLQNKETLSLVNYGFRAKIYSVEELRLMYPDKASEITANDSQQVYDYESGQQRTLNNQVILYTLYYKPSPGMPKGREISFTTTAILENVKYKYDHGCLPFVRMCDLQIPMELHGRSSIENVKSLTSTYNNVLNLIVRNNILCSHPKWMMPAGAAKKESLGNDITIVEYKGPQAPMLVQSTPTSPESYQFLAQLKETFQQIYGIFGVSRGEPPPGITSGVALQFMAEQETERFNEDILRYNEAIRQVAILTLSVAGSYYDASDKRMFRVLGKNNEWTSEFFDVAVLSKDYDVRVQNSSALPQSRAARTQLLLDLQKLFPDRFQADQFLEMFDLAESDKFIDSTTQNVRMAQAETEIMTGDKAHQVIDPQPQQDHIAHWKTHLIEMQKFGYEFNLPLKKKQEMQNHMAAHEMLMLENAKKSPAYGQKLMALDGFPIFFHPGANISAPVQGPQQALPAQGAPQGNPQAPPAPPIQETPGEDTNTSRGPSQAAQAGIRDQLKEQGEVNLPSRQT